MSKTKSLLIATALLACSFTAANAQGKVWKHGILEAKSDSGFIAMVDKGGFAEKRGVKIVGCTWHGMPQVVLAKAEIKTPADLKGRTIAISSPGSLPDLLVRSMLDAEKVAPSEVKFATQGADLDRYKSLLAGITDAAVVSNEFEAVMPSNIKVLMKANIVLPKFIRLCLATTSKVLAERRADLVKFVAAEMDAYKYATTHRDETIKLAHEMTHAKPGDKRAEFITDQTIAAKQIDPALTIPTDRLEWMQELFVKAGTIKKPVPIASVIDASVRDEAAKLAGQ
jgi:NitT/TauT family transport system substrate-binding protein